MKLITSETISTALSALIDETLRSLEPAAVNLINRARETETSPAATWALDKIAENAAIVADRHCYACQDCGLALVFARLGVDVKLDAPLETSIDEGVRRGYANARKSVADPLTRINTGDNTPAIVYVETTDGDELELAFLAKGAGSENMSGLYMLTPSKGRDGIVNAVLDRVKTAGANPCPPIIVGVGIGGTADKAMLLSKKALFRETGGKNPRSDVAALEGELLGRINALGIGAQGLGGKTTALAVAVEVCPTHIGMLPVAVTIQCHSVRHGKIRL